MSSSELSSPLTSPPASENEMPDFNLDGMGDRAGIGNDGASSPESVHSSPKRKRESSPLREPVLADDPKIAVSRNRVHHIVDAHSRPPRILFKGIPTC